MKWFFALFLTFASSAALACSCGMRVAPEEEFDSAEIAAVVRVLSAKIGTYTPEHLYDENGRVYRKQAVVLAEAEVLESLKGRMRDPLLIVAPLPGMPCHEPIVVGESYVVFSSGDWPVLHSWCRPLPLLHTIDPALREKWRGR